MPTGHAPPACRNRPSTWKGFAPTPNTPARLPQTPVDMKGLCAYSKHARRYYAIRLAVLAHVVNAPAAALPFSPPMRQIREPPQPQFGAQIPERRALNAPPFQILKPFAYRHIKPQRG